MPDESYPPETRLYSIHWRDPLAGRYQGPVISLRIYRDPNMRYPERLGDELTYAVRRLLDAIELDNPAVGRPD